MNNIPSMLWQRELLLTRYVILTRGAKEYNRLIHENGSLNEYLHNKGVENDLYIGDYNPKRLSYIKRDALGGRNNNRLVEADGLDAEVAGRVTKKGKLIGPFNKFLNTYEKPYEIKSWGLSIEREDGKYFTYGITDNLKAILMFYGEEVLNHLRVNGRHLNIDEAVDAVKKKDSHIFDVAVSGSYKGHAGDFTVDSCSKKTALSYDASIKQAIMFRNNKIIYHNNTKYANGAAGKIKKIGSRPEYYDNDELTKQELASVLAAKYGPKLSESLGHKLALEHPKGNLVDNLFYLKQGNDYLTITTLYEPIEQPFIYEGFNNEIFSEVNGEAFKEYYIEDKPARIVDFNALNNYWDLILTPKLLFDMIEQQSTMSDRFDRTCVQSGAVILGDLKAQGSSNPLKEPVYNIDPVMIDAYVATPLPSADILINNGAEDIKSKLTFKNNRDYKLFQCKDPVYCCYGGYYKTNHKHTKFPSTKKKKTL
ncbi:MAG: hypothetical protein WC307_01495 [Candidatus Nanoarchaeia archaeon]|jgi:hypothetical protein